MSGLCSEDRREIQDLIHRYAWALDTGDVERFVDCFCADGALVWDAFETPDRHEGAEALRRFATFLRDLPTSAGRQHFVANTLIEEAGDEARAYSYVVVFTRQADGPHAAGVMGWYEDAFRRTPHGWRIRERVIRDWSGPVLARFAGQSGERVARQRPAVLASLASPLPPPVER